jgi:hypothetical protein
MAKNEGSTKLNGRRLNVRVEKLCFCGTPTTPAKDLLPVISRPWGKGTPVAQDKAAEAAQ